MANYIPKLGDRIAIRNFCERQNDGEKKKTTKRSKLFELLRTKVDGHVDCKETSVELESRKSRKTTRKIEFGWIHNKKQVRKRSGGGTRKLDAPTIAVKDDLIKLGKDLFFPGGESRKGHVDDFQYDILDFKETSLPNNATVNDCYDKFKTGMVTFYLSSSCETSICAPEDQEQSKTLPSSTIPCENRPFTEVELPASASCETSACHQVDKEPGDLLSVTDFLTNEEMSFNMNYQFIQGSNENSLMQHVYTGTPTGSNENSLMQHVYTGTPTVTFLLPVTDSYEHPSGNSDHTSADDDLICLDDDLPAIQFKSRRCLSLNKHHRHGSLDMPQETKRSISEAVIQNIQTQQLEPSVENILKMWEVRSQTDDHIEILIHRRKILDSTKRAVGRPDFDFYKRVRVVFSGESSDDQGGPKREFFRLLMQGLKDKITNGTTFQHSVVKLEEKYYEFAGKCVAWSLMNGGPGFPVFSLPVANYILGETVPNPSLNDADQETKDRISQILEAKDLAELDIGWIVDQGVTGAITLSIKQEMVEMILKNSLMYRVSAETQQFRDGLNEVGGLGILMQTFPALHQLLENTLSPLTVNDLKALYTIQYSDKGSNAREQEEDTIYAFECFLQECEDNTFECSLTEILSFWTGAEEVPPMGFTTGLYIRFVNDNAKKNLLPVAHTCGLVLELPKGSISPEDFKQRMLKAIQWGGEFHLA